MSEWIHASPKDTGYSWVVLLGAVLMNMLIPGIIWKIFGILFLTLQERFGATAAQLSGIQSVILGTGLLLGIPANMLAKRYNVRVSASLGTCMMFIGFISSIFVTDIYSLYVTLGLCLGVGSGLLYSPAVIIVGEYFDRKRALAYGISFSGSGLGGLVFSMLTRFFLDQYGLNGTLLLLGGLILNVFVVGMLFRPHEFYRPRSLHRKRMSELKQRLDNNNTDVNNNNTNVNNNNNTRSEQYELRTVTRESNIDVSSYDIKDIEAYKEIDVKVVADDTTKTKTKTDVDKFNWYLLKYPTVILYAITGSMSVVCYSGLMMMSPPQAEVYGYSSFQASLLITIIGVVDVVSRIAAGIIAQSYSPLRIYHASIAVNGVAMACVPLLGRTHYVAMVTTCALSAACAGVFIPLLPIVLGRVAGVPRLHSSYGITMLFVGVCHLVIPAGLGYLRDATGSWDTSYYACAAICAALSALSFSSRFAKRYSDEMDAERGVYLYT